MKTGSILRIFTLGVFALATSLVCAQSNEASQVKISTDGGLRIESSDGQYGVRLGGQLQWDYKRAEQGNTLVADTFEARRSRISIDGKANDWTYRMLFNLGSKSNSAEDLYIGYTGINGWVITAGRQKEPFGFEQLESSSSIVFLERKGATNLFTPGRQNGLMGKFSGANGGFQIGLFEDTSADSRFALTGRVHHLVIDNEQTRLHLGLAHRYAEAASTTALELGATVGSLHLQSEYFWQQPDGPDRDAWYLQAGWLFSGAVRPHRDGVFTKAQPQHRGGLLELVANIERGDGNFGSFGLGTTEARSYGLGLNWYASQLVKVGVNFRQTETLATGADGHEVRGRIQLSF